MINQVRFLPSITKIKWLLSKTAMAHKFDSIEELKTSFISPTYYLAMTEADQGCCSVDHICLFTDEAKAIEYITEIGRKHNLETCVYSITPDQLTNFKMFCIGGEKIQMEKQCKQRRTEEQILKEKLNVDDDGGDDGGGEDSGDE